MKLPEVLAELAQKLGMTVEQLWPYFIKREYLKALIGMSFCSIFLLLCLIVFIIVRKKWSNYEPRLKERCKRTSEENDYLDNTFFLMCALCFVALVLIIIFSANLVNFMYPEVAAFKDMVSMVK